MKRKVGGLLLKVMLIQIFILSVIVSFVALANYTLKKRNTSDDQFGSDIVNVNKRDVIRSVYRYRLPLSGQMGKITRDGQLERSSVNKKRHAKKKENLKLEKVEGKSHRKQKNQYLFNGTVDGTEKMEGGRPKADKKHAESKHAEPKRDEPKRAEQKHAPYGHRKQKHTALGQSRRNRTEQTLVEEKHPEQKHAELGHIKHKHLTRTNSEKKHSEQNRLKQERQERKQVDHKQDKHAMFSASNAPHHQKTSRRKKEEKTM